MKIIFPTKDANGALSKRSEHFGRAKYFTIVTVLEDGTKEFESIKNDRSGHQHGHFSEQEHSCSGTAGKILSLKADSLVVKGIGARPAEIFQASNLQMFIDQNSKNVQESLDLFLAKKLSPLNGKGICSHH